METDHLTQFTSKLLSNNILNCVICKNLLQAPITLVKDVGNMCSVCYNSNSKSTWTGLNNTTLEVILNSLKVPCKYQLNGCKEIVSYTDLKSHQTNCKFDQKPCFMEHCEWIGPQTDLITHFENHHKSDITIIQNDNNSFNFVIDIYREHDFVRLLKVRNNSFILKIFITHEELIYFIYDTQMNEKKCDFECTIIQEGANNTRIQTKFDVIPFSQLYSVLDNNAGYSVGNSIIRQITNAANAVKLTILLKLEVEELNEKLLNNFECPICKNYMKPPIYQCHSGHSICNCCRSKLERCPTCRGSFGGTRNYTLESLTGGIPYPCMYRHLGCVKTSTATDITKHEHSCSFKPHSCPLIGCAFSGNYQLIVGHLKDAHPTNLIVTNFYKKTVDFRHDILIDFSDCDRYYFVIYESIFRLSLTKNSDYRFWAVELLGHYDQENIDFVYEIGIIDMRKPSRKLIRTDLCLKEVNVEELFKKCIIFPNNILSSYSGNGLLTFYCKIYKQ